MMFALTAPNGRPAPAPVLSQMERISSATGKPTEAATAAALPRELVNLTLCVAAINTWNRIAISFRAVHPTNWKGAT